MVIPGDFFKIYRLCFLGAFERVKILENLLNAWHFRLKNSFIHVLYLSEMCDICFHENLSNDQNRRRHSLKKRFLAITFVEEREKKKVIFLWGRRFIRTM